ncbi:LamG-like jellyroll fold domain-containing protein [Candidatus Undinarchaeota archaeon]
MQRKHFLPVGTLLIALLLIAPIALAADFSINTTSDFDDGTHNSTYVKDDRLQLGFYDNFERADVGNGWDITNLDSAEIIGNKLVTEGIVNTWGNLTAAAIHTLETPLTGDFEIETDLEYVERSSDLGVFYLYLHGADGNILAGIGDSHSSAANKASFRAGINGTTWSSGTGTRELSGNVIIKIRRSGDTVYVYEDGIERLSADFTGAISEIRLTNTRYRYTTAPFNDFAGKTAKWDYVLLNGGYISGNWTSSNQFMSTGKKLDELNVHYSSCTDAANNINKIEILDASDDSLITTYSKVLLDTDPLNDKSLRNDASLVSYWRFEDNLDDEKGLNNGDCTNCPSYTSLGKFGGAYNFIGSSANHYINCGNDASLNPEYITISAWVKTSSTIDTNQIISKDDDINRVWQFKKDQDDKLRFVVFNDSAIKSVSGTTTIGDDKWHHVAGVYDGSTVKVYVDGVLDASENFAGSLRSSTNSVFIGRSENANPGYFDGIIDDAAIFDRALSASEIRELYASRQEPLADKSLSDDANFVSYWKFDSDASDSTGSNDGAVTGAVLETGKFGQAYDFDGTNDKIELNTAVLPTDGSTWTVSAWMKPDAVNVGNIQPVFSQYLGAEGRISPIYEIDGNWQFFFGHANGNTIIPIDTATAGVWTHILVAYDGTNLIAYKDGVLKNNTGSLSANIATLDATIGWQYHTTDNRYFDGKIDDVAVFNRALSASEARDIYANKKTLTSADFDNGFDGTTDNDFKIKAYLAGDGASTPAITQIEGSYTVAAAYADLTACNSDSECISNICREDYDGDKFCAAGTVCVSDETGSVQVYSSGSYSQLPAPGTYICRDGEWVKETCTQNSECLSNFCRYDYDGDRFCADDSTSCVTDETGTIEQVTSQGLFATNIPDQDSSGRRCSNGWWSEDPFCDKNTFSQITFSESGSDMSTSILVPKNATALSITLDLTADLTYLLRTNYTTTTTPGIASNNTFSFFYDPGTEKMFVGLASDGLTIIDLTDNSRTDYTTTTIPRLGGRLSRSIFYDPGTEKMFVTSTEIYGGDIGGVTVIDLTDNSSTNYTTTTTPSILSTTAFPIFYDSGTEKMFVGTNAGVTIIDLTDNSRTDYTTITTPGILYDDVRSLSYDPGTEKMFVGMYPAGVTIIDLTDNSRTDYNTTTTPSIISNNVNALSYDSETEKMFVGTYTGGVTIIDLTDNSRTDYNTTTTPSIISNNVNALSYDSETEKMFVGTHAGVTIIDLTDNSRTDYNTTTRPGTLNNQVKSLFYDNEYDSLFVGTIDGLTMFNNKLVTTIDVCNNGTADVMTTESYLPLDISDAVRSCISETCSEENCTIPLNISVTGSASATIYNLKIAYIFANDGSCDSGEDGYNSPADCCKSGGGCPTGCTPLNDPDCEESAPPISDEEAIAGDASGSVGVFENVPPLKREVKLFFENITAGIESVKKIDKRFLEITKFAITTKSNLANFTFTFTSHLYKPDIPDAPGDVLRYFEIEKQNINNSDIDIATFDFKASKTWVAANKIDESSVYMYHYQNSWKQLPTTRKTEDINNIYYSTETDSFSQFAISGSETFVGVAPIPEITKPIGEFVPDLRASIDVPSKINILEPFDAKVKISNNGFGPVENITVSIRPPKHWAATESQQIQNIDTLDSVQLTFQVAPAVYSEETEEELIIIVNSGNKTILTESKIVKARIPEFIVAPEPTLLSEKKDKLRIYIVVNKPDLNYQTLGVEYNLNADKNSVITDYIQPTTEDGAYITYKDYDLAAPLTAQTFQLQATLFSAGSKVDESQYDVDLTGRDQVKASSVVGFTLMVFLLLIPLLTIGLYGYMTVTAKKCSICKKEGMLYNCDFCGKTVCYNCSNSYKGETICKACLAASKKSAKTPISKD